MKIICWTTGTLLTIWFVAANSAVLKMLGAMFGVVGVHGVPEAGFAGIDLLLGLFSLAMLMGTFVGPAYYCLYGHIVACKKYREAIALTTSEKNVLISAEIILLRTEYILLGIACFYILSTICIFVYPHIYK